MRELERERLEGAIALLCFALADEDRTGGTSSLKRAMLVN
jgi:hypothetical protein